MPEEKTLVSQRSSIASQYKEKWTQLQAHEAELKTRPSLNSVSEFYFFLETLGPPRDIHGDLLDLELDPPRDIHGNLRELELDPPRDSYGNLLDIEPAQLYTLLCTANFMSEHRVALRKSEIEQRLPSSCLPKPLLSIIAGYAAATPLLHESKDQVNAIELAQLSQHSEASSAILSALKSTPAKKSLSGLLIHSANWEHLDLSDISLANIVFLNCKLPSLRMLANTDFSGSVFIGNCSFAEEKKASPPSPAAPNFAGAHMAARLLEQLVRSPQLKKLDDVICTGYITPGTGRLTYTPPLPHVVDSLLSEGSVQATITLSDYLGKSELIKRTERAEEQVNFCIQCALVSLLVMSLFPVVLLVNFTWTPVAAAWVLFALNIPLMLFTQLFYLVFFASQWVDAATTKEDYAARKQTSKAISAVSTLVMLACTSCITLFIYLKGPAALLLLINPLFCFEIPFIVFVASLALGYIVYKLYRYCTQENDQCQVEKQSDQLVIRTNPRNNSYSASPAAARPTAPGDPEPDAKATTRRP